MDKISLKERLYILIQDKGILSYGDMCQFTAEEGYKVSTSERRLRELMAKKVIAPIMKKSKRNTPYIAAYVKPGMGGKKPEEIRKAAELVLNRIALPPAFKPKTNVTQPLL